MTQHAQRDHLREQDAYLDELQLVVAREGQGAAGGMATGVAVPEMQVQFGEQDGGEDSVGEEEDCVDAGRGGGVSWVLLGLRRETYYRKIGRGFFEPRKPIHDVMRMRWASRERNWSAQKERRKKRGIPVQGVVGDILS